MSGVNFNRMIKRNCVIINMTSLCLHYIMFSIKSHNIGFLALKNLGPYIAVNEADSPASLIQNGIKVPGRKGKHWSADCCVRVACAKFWSKRNLEAILVYVINFDFLGFHCIVWSEVCLYLPLWKCRNSIVSLEPMTIYGLSLIMKVAAN